MLLIHAGDARPPLDGNLRIELLERLWRSFAETRQWLPEKPLLLEYERRGVDLDAFRIEGVSRTTHPRNELVPTFAALAELPSVQSLLAPLPNFLRHAAAKILNAGAAHDFGESPVTVEKAEFLTWWREDQAELVRWLIGAAHLLAFSGWMSSATDFHFQVAPEAIRYADVESLQDVYDARHGTGAFDIERNPGWRIDFLEWLIAYASDNGAWPRAVDCAFTHRRLGLSLEVIERECGGLLTAHSAGGRDFRVGVAIDAVKRLRKPEQIEGVLPSLVRRAADFWKASADDSVQVSLADMTSGLPLSSVAPALLVLQHEPWIGGSFRAALDARWTIRIDRRVWPFRGVQSWNDYLAVRDAHYRNGAMSSISQSEVPMIERSEYTPPSSQFVQGAYYLAEENEEYEFKEVKGPNPVDAIKNSADEYAVAFLNSKRGGAILWGVANDRRVVGVELDSQARDLVRRAVNGKLTAIRPSFDPRRYTLSLESVCDLAGRAFPNLFVVELRVPAKPLKGRLFTTASGDCWVRVNGVTQKLNPEQLQDALARGSQRRSTKRQKRQRRQT